MFEFLDPEVDGVGVGLGLELGEDLRVVFGEGLRVGFGDGLRGLGG